MDDLLRPTGPSSTSPAVSPLPHSSCVEAGIEDAVQYWKARVGYTGPAEMMACGVWGDGAPYSKRDNIILWSLTVLSGRHFGPAPAPRLPDP